MKKFCIFIFMLALLPARFLEAAPKLRIAVMNIKANGVDERIARAVTNIITAEIVNFDRFTVLEREEIDKILKEQGFQMTGCTEQSCAVQVGKILSVQKIMLGEINAIGGKMVLTVRLVDVEKSVSEYSARDEALNEKEIDRIAVRIAGEICKKIDDGTRINYSSYYLRGIVPGWGQWHAGNKIRSGIVIGGFVTAVTLTGYAYYDFQHKKNDYNNLKKDTASREEFDRKYNDYKKAGTLFAYSLALVPLVYAINWIDVLLFSKNDFTESLKRKKSENKTGMIDIGISSNLHSGEPVYMIGLYVRF